jgi:hypothetical protein
MVEMFLMAYSRISPSFPGQKPRALNKWASASSDAETACFVELICLLETIENT